MLFVAFAAACDERTPTAPGADFDGPLAAALTIEGGSPPAITTTGAALVNIFFTDGGADRAGGGPGTVRSVKPDGSGLMTLVPAAGPRPRGIALDYVNGHLYWNDFNSGLTQRSALDGSGVTTIVNHGQAGINDIDLDIAAGHIYMSMSVSFAPFHGVRRVNFDGTGLTNVIATWPPFGPAPAGVPMGWFIDGLAVDPANGHIYYGDIGVLVPNGGPSGIVRTNLDGTGAASLVPHLDGRGRGIALDLAGGKMYFGQHNPASSGSGNIWSANLDGTGLGVIVAGLQRPRDLALDKNGGKVYWVDERTLKIQSANLDGTGVADVIGGLDGPSSLALQFNEAPDCSEAEPSTEILWPPNHKFVPIDVLGVTDPEGDAFSIVIDAIFQDEPTDTFGDGAFTPDGQGVGTSTAEVRAERSGTPAVPGNGRVYHIFFTATDSNGGSCSSAVRVGVPHDVKDSPVDDGPLYDSTM